MNEWMNERKKEWMNEQFLNDGTYYKWISNNNNKHAHNNGIIIIMIDNKCNKYLYM